MTAQRVLARSLRLIGALGVALLCIALWLILVEVESYARLTDSGSLFLVIWPNLHWLLLWLAAAVAGFRGWRPLLPFLLLLSPALVAHALQGLRTNTGRLVGILPLDLLFWAQGLAEVLLCATALAGAACWAWARLAGRKRI